jgi:hypothetical protein
MYTEFIETGSLYAYARICLLRLDPHAQKEIQDYAQAVYDSLVTQFPVSWAALMASLASNAQAPTPAPMPTPTPEPTPAPTPAPPTTPLNEYPDMSHLNHWGC